MYIMADKLSDEELVEQLANHGEKIKLPLTENRRSILRKKLNHLLAKNRRRSAPVRQKTSRNDLSGFSSDDTDSECITAVAGVSSSHSPSAGFASPASSYSSSANVSRSRSTRISTSAAGISSSNSTSSPKSSHSPQYHHQSDRRSTTTLNHKKDTRHSTSSPASSASANIPNNTAATASSPYSGWHNATPQSVMMHSHNNPPSSTPQALKSTIKSGPATTTTTKKYGYKVTIPYGTPPAPSVSPGLVDGTIGNSGYPNHHQQHHHHPHHHLHSQQQQQALHSRVHPSTPHHTRGRRSSSRAVAAAIAAAAAAQKKSRPGTTVFESSDSDIGLEDDDDDDEDDDDEDDEDDDQVKDTSSPLKSAMMSSSAYSPSSSSFHNNSAKYSTSTTVNRTPTSKILKEFRQNYTKTRKNPYKLGITSWNPYLLCGFEGPFRERNSHCISWVLPIVAALFFIVLGIVYVRNWNNNGTLPETNEAFLRIQAFCNNNNTVFTNCSNSHIDNILWLLKVVYEDLSDKYGKVECGYTTKTNRMKISIADLRRLIAKNLNEMDTESFARIIVWLVTDSEDWGIRPLTADGNNTTVVDEVKYLESYVPNMNFICRLRRAVVRMIYQLLLGFLGFIFAILLFRFYLVKRKSTEEEQRQVYEMVEKIIDILKCHCEAMARQDEDTYLAVQHVRDQLLPPAQRKQLLSTWENAAKFIEDNESRIRLETRAIEGEEFQVWRWLPNLNNGGKIWQGQAFGEHDDAGTPPYSPTPCLKIRNMFEVDMEEGENWQINIEDAILEKCKNITGILHIFVDKGSREGCVYIKCDTCVTAGQVHRALHGWWFDRRLVTVKYLRLEYYHERFPDSRMAITPMHPSTSSRMHSLSQPFYKSTLEMT